MLVYLLAVIGRIKIYRYLCARKLLPIHLRGNNKVLVLSVNEESECVLKLAVNIETVEALGKKDHRFIGEALIKALTIYLLNVLSKEDAPPLRVAVIVGCIIIVIVNSYHRTYIEVRNTEDMIVFVILYGKAVTVILLPKLTVGDHTLHEYFKSVKILYADSSVIRRYLDSVEYSHIYHIAVCILVLKLEDIILLLILVKHAVKIFVTEYAVIHKSIGYAVLVIVGL